MKKLMGVMMAFGLILGAAACNKDEAAKPADKGATTTTTTTTKTEAAKPAEKPADKPATAAPAGGDIGVAECDDYIKKMSDCAGKMQPEAAGPMKESMETMKKAWKDAASTPEGKTALASGCKQALDAAKSAYASMGCSF
jgi:hypothetical protein